MLWFGFMVVVKFLLQRKNSIQFELSDLYFGLAIALACLIGIIIRDFLFKKQDNVA